MQDLYARQRSREHVQYQEGIERYRKEAQAQPIGEQAAGKGLVAVATKHMIPVVKGYIEDLESGKTLPSQVPLGYHYLLGLEPEAVCAIAARVAVSSAYRKDKLTRTAVRLANLIEEDYRLDELMQAEPALGNSMERKAKRRSVARQRRTIMRKAANVAGIHSLGWTEPEKLKLGILLLETFVTTTGFARLAMEVDGQKTSRVLEMPEEILERIAKNHERIEADRPVNVPMICPPVPWTSPKTGGYITDLMQAKTPLVRSVSYETRDDLFSSDMPEVYEAVNNVQATPWRINRSVFNVLVQAHAGNGMLAGLPSMDDLPLPGKPAFLTEDWTEDKGTEREKAAFTEWKQRMREAHDENAKIRSKRLALLTKIRLARELIDEERIYFPHSLDFRGRVYSMTAELTPQGDDISKGLIEFAKGKPLGDSGAYWLHVHLANCYGVDKVSFEDRVLWVELNSEAIMDSARDPLDGKRFWCEADDPWSFLAACFEYAGWRTEGDDYVSHLPIHMDGSCSGIQHFSAMLRDPEGGRAVNLTKRDTPADIYTEVLGVVKTKLAADKDPLAKVWLDKVDRKIVKRPCMTFAYSVTRIGIRDQIASEMRKQADGQYLPGWENWQAAAFLAPIVEEAIREVVKRAAEAMDWLRAISKTFNDEQIPAMWVTPLGFPVVQPYRNHKGMRVQMWFNGVRVKLSLSVEQKDVDKRKHTSSIAPNFVHSLDACHLMMVVNRLAREGITDSFAMIHDSFGVHACDVDEMHFAIRDEFIKLYSQDILVETYRSTLLAIPGEKWPDVQQPPEAGDLDLEEVRDADFFFA